MIVHAIDGTYELFRHFYGLRRFNKGVDAPYGAVLGVLRTVVQMLEGGATHLGVATDHVIESFRNDIWPGYKTGAGIDHALWRQFHPLEDALRSMGVVVWAMTDLEADDAQPASQPRAGDGALRGSRGERVRREEEAQAHEGPARGEGGAARAEEAARADEEAARARGARMSRPGRNPKCTD